MAPEHNDPAAVAERYLLAVAAHDWDVVTACVAGQVVRHGPFGDDFTGADDYLSFLRRTMPSLAGYRMDIDRVTGIGDRRAMVELRETVELDGRPVVTHECLVFDVGSDGRLTDIAIYIRHAPPA